MKISKKRKIQHAHTKLYYVNVAYIYYYVTLCVYSFFSNKLLFI